ncbi:MAG TPA: MBL fold metallo-hydrolase [Thiotrichales bacterium]|nr:MBL fold metallo-hydrolase [Thiotrichales bacterium]
MRFASLGSGSRGNALLVEAGSTRVMLDCGFSLRVVETRLGRLGLSAEEVDAVLVTHEHADHIQGVSRFAARYRIPVWCTGGTAEALEPRDEVTVHNVLPEAPFSIGDLQIHPFTVPHDAREPCQFRFTDGAFSLGVLTDAGHCTPHLKRELDDLDGLFLETNHDRRMLAAGPYPPSLKRRVAGDYGHLSNCQAAALLETIRCDRLQHIVCAHLSDRNNHPDLARSALAEVLECTPEWVGVAHQERGLPWREIR